MEMEQFDDLTRHLSDAGSSRRQVMRALGAVLLGGALTGAATRLGLAEDAAAKGKQHKAKPKHERTPQAERKAHGQLQAEGKGKHKNKHHKHPKDPPPPPDPPCPDGQGQCSDGACVPFDQCCSDQFRCADDSCVNVFDCCPDEQRCSAELCIKKDLCCPDAIPPLCSQCYEEACVNGALTCRHTPGCCPAGFVSCPPTDGGCCAGGEYMTVNGRPFCAARWGSRVYCDSATGQ